MSPNDPAERVRRAIALMTQVRCELMCDEVYDFLEGGESSVAVSGTNVGVIRCALQMHLRKLGLHECLEDESLEGIVRSRSAEETAQSNKKPDCVPDGARWAWVTDGLGSRVEAWVAVGAVIIADPEDPYDPWFWNEKREIWGHFDGTTFPALTPALAAQCRRLRDGDDPQDPETGEVRL